jgi:hypothetical protein
MADKESPEEHIPPAVADEVRADLDDLFERMQTPENRSAVDRAFRRDPKDYGKVIIEETHKEIDR